MVYDELLNKIFIDDISSSEYRPSRQSIFLRVSSIRLRSRAASIASSSCRSSADERHYSDNEFDSDSDTSSRTYRQRSTQALTQALNPISKASFGQSFRPEGKNVQYCTQKCLRGLVKEGSLDKMCSNALNHEESHHQIDKPTFLNLIRQQLFKSLNIDCKSIGLHEAREALFIVRLTSHGYILAAKCIIIDFVAHLKREAVIYERLRPIHGTHVSMYLGNVDLDHSYVYDDIAEIVHMMFIDFEGQFISRHINSVNSVQIIEQFERSIQAIHQLRVLHRDMMSRNIL
jgi:serine/threonine protein kinase